MRTVWQMLAAIALILAALAAVAFVLNGLLILVDRRCTDLASVREEDTRRALLDEGLARTLNRSDR